MTQITNEDLKWKCDTQALIKEVVENMKGGEVMKMPFMILKGILIELAERCIEVNDDELNKIMVRLGLYEKNK